MITYRQSGAAEIAYQTAGVATPASSVQLGGPSCLTFSVRKYFTHVFPSDRMSDHTNYTSIISNDLATDQRQFSYEELVQDKSKDGWIVDVMTGLRERAGGSL